jgi:hypothetical protein
MNRVMLWGLLGSLAGWPAAGESFLVDPEAGNNTFTAVFDAPLGERITAVSSSVSCRLDLDERASTASGICSVPLTAIRVDNEDTKTEHFQQWTTNKKTPAGDCKLEVQLAGVRLEKLEPGKAVKFSGDVPFTVCGRRRTDGAKEHIEGMAVLLPGSQASKKTVKIKAHLEKFSRDQYRIGPKYTEGWLSRVQSLADVVADQGVIDLTLFAKEGKSPAKAQ